MAIKEKMLLGTVAFCLLSSATATYAEVNVDLNLGGPAYVAAAPVYVSPYPTYYDPHHRRHDFEYWQNQHRERADNRGHEHDDHRR